MTTDPLFRSLARTYRQSPIYCCTGAAVVAVVIAASLACNERRDAERPSVARATAESTIASDGCKRLQTQQPAVAQSTTESTPDSHYNDAWWLTARFRPAADTILSVPVNLVDSSWSKATVLTRDLMPPQAHDDPGALAETGTFGFSFDGDFNGDGRRDRAVVGVYRTRACEQGRFLLILTEIRPDHWQRTFLRAVPGDPGFSLLSRERAGGLGWWSCMQCDNWAELVWANTTYVLKFHPGGDVEPTDTAPATASVDGRGRMDDCPSPQSAGLRISAHCIGPIAWDSTLGEIRSQFPKPIASSA